MIPQDIEDDVGKQPELNYLSQIVIKVFEDKAYEADDPRRFLVQMMYSTGASHAATQHETFTVRPHGSTSIFPAAVPYPALSESNTLNNGMYLETLLEFLEQYIPYEHIKQRSNSVNNPKRMSNSGAGKLSDSMPPQASTPASSQEKSGGKSRTPDSTGV